MGSIDKSGFLSSELHAYVVECRRRYADWFGLVTDASNLAQSVLAAVTINRDDYRQSLSALFFGRLLAHAQGAILLAERCMPTQVEVLCRASIEALFGLLAIVEREDTVDLLIKGDRHHRLVLLRGAHRRLAKASELGDPSPERETLETSIRELARDLTDDPSPKVLTACLAERAGQRALYDSAYKVLSLPVHSNLRDLARQLGLDAEGNPTSIGWGPTFENIDHLLMTVTETLLRAIEAMARLFNLSLDDELRALSDRLRSAMIV